MKKYQYTLGEILQEKSGYGRAHLKARLINLEDVESMLELSNFAAVGRELGVSDNAIRKFLCREREDSR